MVYTAALDCWPQERGTGFMITERPTAPPDTRMHLPKIVDLENELLQSLSVVHLGCDSRSSLGGLHSFSMISDSIRNRRFNCLEQINTQLSGHAGSTAVRGVRVR
ncbi:hypothetical protein M404DRAFT_1003644 [Pisolithus tinctorius Marx 270]|uniref:Uncharacterized protein n=1 Tax=Pisolithus tinctorius Marx 270 TaxID=870435 RepID=A0A0C3IUV7_PISTI|nr:hypothetical protein M404DRAFT_1003644 [Pisolithus tinctorius Marx 270]